MNGQSTRRRRTQAAVNHVATDGLPYAFQFAPPVTAKLCAHYGTDDLHNALGLHVVGLAPGGPKPLWAGPDEFGPRVTDEFGVVWATSANDRGYPCDHPLEEPRLDGYRFPDPDAPGRLDALPDQVRTCPDGYRLLWTGDFWERAGMMRGLDRLLADTVLNPGFVEALLDRLAEYILTTIDRTADLDVDAMALSDDYGMQHAMQMSPDAWRRFIKPHVARMFARIHRAGKQCFLHSCGHIVPIIPDLIDIGLDILHPIQPEAMDVFELKRRFGRDLCLNGGIGTQRLLPHGTPTDVRDGVLACAERLRDGGGYILEPGITVLDDVPMANLLALIETARDLGR